jgi:hypothetical protein
MAVLVKSGKTISADFQPLIDLLAEVQAADYDNAEAQVEHFRRHVEALRIHPMPLEWATIAHAAGTATAILDLIPAELWRMENITPITEG